MIADQSINARRKAMLGFGVAGAYITAFILFARAIFVSSDYAVFNQPLKLHFVYLGTGLIVYAFGHELNMLLKDYRVIRQWFVVDMIAALVFGMLMIRGREELIEAGREKYFLSFAMIILVCLGLCVRTLFAGRKFKALDFEGICSSIRENKRLIILVVILLIIAVFQTGSEPRWDGAYLFFHLDSLYPGSIFNMYSLSFCDHISMSYCACNEILSVILGDLMTGMNVGNIALFVCSVFSVYGIMKILFGGSKGDFEITALTAIYAVSPFVLGLVNYNYWDYWVITLFPVVVYFAMTEQWVFHLIAAFVFCFVKETAVLAYAFYCLGLVFSDWLYDRERGGIKKRTIHILKRKRYYGMAAIGGLWLYMYIKLPNWNGEGDFSVNLRYIARKLSVLAGLQFNWILCIISIIVLAVLLVKRKWPAFYHLIPILLSDIAFIIFNCVFQTVNHARYMDSHIAVLNIIAVYGIGLIGSKIGRYVCITVMLILMGASNYLTFDPVTLQIFSSYNVGHANIVSTARREILSDSMVYNQQYRYFDEALDRALKDVVEEGVVCFPAVGGVTWFFSGLGDEWTPTETYRISEENWDYHKEKRVRKKNSNTVDFLAYNITSECNLTEILNGAAGYYFYLSIAGEDILDFIEENANIVERKEFEYRGWVVNRVKFIQ